ncbi:MAG: 5-guanidino-2-oxopentanoate decarboxylase [Leucobacter sp.]|nr:5-guanidino-2-oxopentanoate decarboxylase [Leucobacter sp.]
MKLGAAISALLRQYGVEHVFGIPGVHTLELFRDIETSGVEMVVPRHEQGAGYMADAYSRVTGRPGVCYLITGPGVTNAMTPIAQAWHDSTPLLVIASTVERAQFDAHRGTLHDTPDLAEVLRPFTLISENATSAEHAVRVIDEAFARWRTERPRPVYLGIPLDLLAEEVGELTRPALAAAPSAASAAAPTLPAAAASLLSAAERPVIIAGGGARHDGPAVAELAERLTAPVILTGNAKGLLAADHPLFAGVSGFFPSAHRLLESADLVIALGTEIADSEGFVAPPVGPRLPRILRVDIDPAATHPQQPNPPIVMRVAEFAAAALAQLPEQSGESIEAGHAHAAEVRTELAEALAESPYGPWITAIEHAIPADTVLAADSAQVAYQSHALLRLDTPGRWLAPYGFGTLGPALPMAIGAAVGAPGRPVVALSGDGGSLFTLTELATLADLDAAVVVVIWDNGGYGEIEKSFEREGIRPAGVRASARDLAAIARGFGIHAVDVTEPAGLETELRAAIERRGPAVIVVAAPEGLRVSGGLRAG